MPLRIDILRYLLLSVLAGCGLVACSGGPAAQSATESADPPDSDGDEGSDEPVWINGSLLTCGWGRIVSSTAAQVRCRLDEGDLSGLDMDNLTIAWIVRDEHGQHFKSASVKTGPVGSYESAITMLAHLINGKWIEAELSDGNTVRRIKTSFNTLEGMGEGGALTECFALGKVTVKDCFTAAGVLVDINEAVTKQNKTKSVSCSPGGLAHSDPDILCEIKSDAAMGGLGTTWQWFDKQDHLIADDGTLRASDFCDANGIKPQHALSPIDQQIRTFDYWDDGSMPCYDDLRAAFQSSPNYHPQVAADPDQGIDGEPYCFFVIIKNPLIIDGYGLDRLHIIKNPKVFPDAANDNSVTLDRLKKTAKHFSCEKVEFAE